MHKCKSRLHLSASRLLQKKHRTMAKENASYIELSLFDDSFFENQTTQEVHPSAQAEQGEEAKEDVVVRTKDKKKQTTGKADDSLLIRKKRLKLKVTWADGDTCCEASATATMLRTIERIGVERVASLGMKNCHIPLVSTEVDPRYADWTKEIQPGWYLMAQGNTDQKYLQLKSIVTQLALDIEVELGDFETTQPETPKKKSLSRKKKTWLKVVFPNGKTIRAATSQQTFQEVVETVGTDKVKRTHLKISGSPIVTATQMYHTQVQLKSGEWLTVPAQTKDRYKILRVISSMTHTPFEVSLVEFSE